MRTHRARLLAAASVTLMLASLPAAATPSGDRLIAAAQDGLTAEADALLAKHTDVNATDSAGATALAWAVMRGNDAVAARLLKAHADPNRTDANGVSPLLLAIDSNAPALVKLLLANGANASLARDNGETPLMHAIQAGSFEMVQMLVDSKADVNARENQFGQTALMWAAGRPEMTTLLLAHGADFRAVTKSWETSTVNYITTTSTLGATGIPWNNEGSYSGKAGGSTPMLFAVQAGDLKSVEALIAAGADVNQAAADGTTPLLASLYNFSSGAGMATGRNASRGLRYAPSLAIANLLLDHGAQINISDRAGYTPLHGAMLVLVSGGTGRLPQIGFQPGKLSTPDEPAPKIPKNEAEGLKLVARLLEQKADPNAATSNTTPGPVGALRVNPASAGSTPFHLAAFAHSAKLIDLMAAHGANPNIVRKDGHTPFSLSVMSNDLPVVQAMVAHGADLKMRYNPLDKVAGTDPLKADAYPRGNETILHIAAIPGANYVVEYLAQQGVPLDAKNSFNQTALQLADEQEQFRFMHDKEGPHGIGLEGANKGKVIVRETQTTDAFKRAMGLKTHVATN
jgi:ankyrin repeat protein